MMPVPLQGSRASAIDSTVSAQRWRASSMPATARDAVDLGEPGMDLAAVAAGGAGATAVGFQHGHPSLRRELAQIRSAVQSPV